MPCLRLLQLKLGLHPLQQWQTDPSRTLRLMLFGCCVSLHFPFFVCARDRSRAGLPWISPPRPPCTTPLSRSKPPSPPRALGNASPQALGLGALFVYEKMQCDNADAVAAAIGAGCAVVGGSVTMPLKQSVVRLCAVLSPAASCIGCVNTLSLQPCGGGESSGAMHVVGDNTDWAGMLACLTRVLRSCSSTQPVTCAVIVGSGATARSAAFALLHLPCITAVYVCNRTRARAAALAAEFNAGSFGLEDEAAPRGMQGQRVLLVSTVSRPTRHPASLPLIMRCCLHRPACLREAAVSSAFLTPAQQGPCLLRPHLAPLAPGVRRRFVRLRLRKSPELGARSVSCGRSSNARILRQPRLCLRAAAAFTRSRH